MITKVDLLTFVIYFSITLPIAQGLTVLVHRMKKRPVKKSYLVLSGILSAVLSLFLVNL